LLLVGFNSVSLSKQNRRFQETMPLISFNDSIEIVRQFHWFCLTISMESFTETGGFAS